MRGFLLLALVLAGCVEDLPTYRTVLIPIDAMPPPPFTDGATIGPDFDAGGFGGFGGGQAPDAGRDAQLDAADVPDQALPEQGLQLDQALPDAEQTLDEGAADLGLQLDLDLEDATPAERQISAWPYTNGVPECGPDVRPDARVECTPDEECIVDRPIPSGGFCRLGCGPRLLCPDDFFCCEPTEFAIEFYGAENVFRPFCIPRPREGREHSLSGACEDPPAP